MATAFKPAPSRFIVNDASELPNLYAMTGQGTCMEPVVKDGATLAFSKTIEPQPGDVVIVWLREERQPAGTPQCLLKKLVSGWPKGAGQHRNVAEPVIVEMLNPPRRLLFAPGDVLAVHRCIGPDIPTGNGRADVTRQQTEGGE